MDDLPKIDQVFPSGRKAREEGWRLHVYREEGEGLLLLAEERVLPERVDRVDAQRVLDSKRLWLTTDDQRWLLDVLRAALRGVKGE